MNGWEWFTIITGAATLISLAIMATARHEKYCMVFMAMLIVGYWCAPTWAANLDQEALAEFQKRVGSLIVKCGDSHYVKIEERYMQFAQAAQPVRWISRQRVYQWKGLDFLPKSRPLSQADRLNGIEWAGDIVLTAGASRMHIQDTVNPYRHQTGWHPWVDDLRVITDDWPANSYGATLTKKSGVWTVNPGHGWRTEYWDDPRAPMMSVPRRVAPMTCTEVPSAEATGYLCSALSRATAMWAIENKTADQPCALALQKCGTYGAKDCIVAFEGPFWLDRSNVVTLQCNQGTREFTGTGRQAIDEAYNFALQSKWYGCIFHVKP